MDDAQKWLEAAAGIEQDLEYLRNDLAESDIEQLKIALAMYRGNAASGAPWPSPDDLFCIERLRCGSETLIATETRRDFKLACQV
jgi:hypothetical protein